MAASDVHTLYAVDVDPITAANAVFIDQVSDFSVDPRLQEILQAADGRVDPQYVAVMAQDPRIRFSTTALATVLAEVGAAFFRTGIAIDSDVTHDGLECFFQLLVEGGTRAGATSHLKLTVNEGLLIPRQISANQGAVASLALECLCTYDGTNEPIVLTAAQTLIGTPAVGELFTLGPVEINGVALAGVQSVIIDPGIQEIVQSADGAVWPQYVAIMSRQPRITITTLQALSLNTFGLDGTAQGATDSVIYLRKIAEGAARVANATAEHISFTIDEGIIYIDNVGGQHGAPLLTRITITPTYDGTNEILVISAATAIT